VELTIIHCLIYCHFINCTTVITTISGGSAVTVGVGIAIAVVVVIVVDNCFLASC